MTLVARLASFCGLLGVVLTLDVPTQNDDLWAKRSTEESDGGKYDPDIDLDTPEMIRRAGYPAEAHVVLTEDGYLLTLHRLPGNKDSPPVLLQHGLLSSSADWVILGKNKSLVFILADQGYDVWIGNFRGNIYSRAHVSLSPSDIRFWNFSFHELGIYDLPTMISYITNMRSQALHTYIGHSMGNTAFYIMAAEKPQITRMVRKVISLAPATFMGHVKTPIRYLAPFANDFKIIADILGNGELLPQNFVLRFLAKFGCEASMFEKKICVNLIFLICGFDEQQFNYTLLPVILNHTPSGSSTKALVHYLQEIKSDKFCQFDYGRKKNLVVYNATEPPDYDFTNVTVPIALVYADNDLLVDDVDLKRFSSLLNNVVDMYRVPWPKFNHLDFMWGKDAPKLVYERVLEIMRKKNQESIEENYVSDREVEYHRVLQI